MRWCWQQDFRSRPSANHLIEVLSSDSVPQLVEAVSLQGTTAITCSALCIVPIEHSSGTEVSWGHVTCGGGHVIYECGHVTVM